MEKDLEYGRLFSTIPYGAGLFEYIDWEKASEEEVRRVVQKNLTSLRDQLRQHLEMEQKQMAELLELQKQKRAIRDFLGL